MGKQLRFVLRAKGRSMRRWYGCEKRADCGKNLVGLKPQNPSPKKRCFFGEGF